MKKLNTLICSLLAAVAFIMAAQLASAQDEASPELTQSEVALVLAHRLGFFVGVTRPPSPQEAVKQLLENKISPLGGWQLDQPLLVNDLTRLLVQALGREQEIPVEERGNPETTAYTDFLVREFDFDIAKIMNELLRVPASNNPQNSGPIREAVSSDPLRGRGEGGDQFMGGTPGTFNIPISERFFKETLQIIVPVPGGGGDEGAVDEKQVNATPSAPQPQPQPTPTPGPTATPQPMPTPGPTLQPEVDA